MFKKYTLLIFLFFNITNLFAYHLKHETYPMDYQITENILMLFALNSTVNDLNLEVTTNNGTVTLVGVTHTDIKARKAIEIASCTPGVHDVDTAQLSLDYGLSPSQRTIFWGKKQGKWLQSKHYPCDCL